MSALLEAPQPTLIPNYVAGSRRNAPGGKTLEVTSPLDGSVIGSVTLSDADEVDRVTAVAREAFVKWSATSVKDRVQVLYKFKYLVEQHLEELGHLVARENGKLPAEGRAGIEKGLEVVEYACSLPQLIAGEILEVSNGVDCYTRRYPLGVVAGITPFNFPAMVPMWMFPIAIACGNTFILKPSEQVPLTPLRLAELLKEAGLPDGVFNVVQGNRATVEAILDHPGIAAVAFVGSTPVAKAVYERGTRAGKRVLTLGGAKNHLVVVPDADVEVTARNVVSSFTGCAGQRCMAASVLITVGECDHIVEAIVETAKKVRPGQEMGAIISAQARDRIVSYIDLAEKEGASLRTDGRGAKVEGKEKGYYVGPTVLVHPDRNSKCLQDEIFGPVISVIKVKTLDEALAIENANPYGNAASIYTTSGAVARTFEQRASAGMIGINIGVPVPREPFAFGGWNDSKFGVGDITGKDGIAFWTKPKKVTEKWTAGASKNWMS
jgi:malonate-semialdehyde dehydrogenase (acetylating)/methylmalonate-semialdehyde dehydrogenase